ncbi:MAG: hypothetical protein ACT4P2_17090 [Pseudomonadota bacterium]
MPAAPDPLPEIPLIEIGAGGPLALIAAARERAEALLAAGRRRYSRPVLRLGDLASRAWLERARNPLRHEIAAVAAALPAPGAFMLNLSFEWTCTSGAAPDPGGRGNRMLRVLDWPLDGLGRHVVVAHEDAPAGRYYNVTWPGAVGVLTAMAPGRFAAAINQAPMPRHGLPLIGDWAVNRLAVWQSDGLPPSHLLRQVFREAGDYGAAKRMLVEARLVLPSLFVLSGIAPSEGCIIERPDGRAVVHEAPAACANLWLSPGLKGRPRGRDNRERAARLATLQAAPEPTPGFDWVRPPILNAKTRLAVIANAASGELGVLGIERQRPATREFRLSS